MRGVEPPLIQYWHSESVPEDVSELFALFEQFNPDMCHMVFHERTAKDLIEAHFSLRQRAAFEACAVPAMQADFFRYCAVYALGGVYCDADARCSGSLTPLLRTEGAMFQYGPAPERIINDLFAFARPGHPLLRMAIDIATSGIETRFSQRIGIVTGPYVFTILWQTFLHGSVDVYLEELSSILDQNPAVPVDRNRWPAQREAIRTILGNSDEIADAFVGVRVSPAAKVDTMVDRGVSSLTYKKTSDHFPNWKGSSYRDA